MKKGYKRNPLQVQLEEFTDKAIDKVLAALDEAAKELTGQDKKGWKDKDLPKFFPQLSQQAERIFWRSKGLDA